MQIRRSLFIGSLLVSCYVAIAGCGDDADSGSPVAAGPDATADTTPPDTFRPDTATQSDGRSPELTGSACTVASECYGDIDAGSLKGEPVCIDKVTNGYCTHKCTVDADCCAVPGECRTGLKQVCAPFESTSDSYCFLSCEPDDIAAATDAGASDAGTDTYCENNVSTDFSCRSTGGGADNRKVCLPSGAAGDGGKKDAAVDAPDGG
jgi:hypothetical protein